MKKSHIISEIQRLAANSSGAAPGWRKLQKEAGINYSDWCGVHWARWNDALADAGFAPNRLTEAYSDSVLLDHYARLAEELGHLPTGADLRLRTQSDPGFPSDKTFGRLGSKLEIASMLIPHCQRMPNFEKVALWASEYQAKHKEEEVHEPSNSERLSGYVYMLRYGKRYKIGFTNSPTRRFREVSIELPDETHQVHTIATDDPNGIEGYWHKRFAARRIRNSEWFELTGEDVRAFKRRVYQ